MAPVIRQTTERRNGNGILQQIIVSECRFLLVFSLRVKVEYIGHIRNVLDSRRNEEIEVKEEASVADLLSALSSKHGQAFRKAIYEPQGEDVKPNYIVTVNGYLLNQLDGLETRLKNGDHVAILPIVSGG